MKKLIVSKLNPHLLVLFEALKEMSTFQRNQENCLPLECKKYP